MPNAAPTNNNCQDGSNVKSLIALMETSLAHQSPATASQKIPSLPTVSSSLWSNGSFQDLDDVLTAAVSICHFNNNEIMPLDSIADNPSLLNSAFLLKQ